MGSVADDRQGSSRTEGVAPPAGGPSSGALTRRSALLAGAGTLAVSSSVGARLRTRWGETRAIRKAVKLEMVQSGANVREKFELLAAIGFDGVEVSRPSDIALEELQEASRATGLPIHGVVDSLHWKATLGDPDGDVRERGIAALEGALRDAAALGASTVLLVPALVNAQIAYDDAYRLSQLAIRQALPLASELGVKIALENVWNNFLLSPLEAKRYVDEFESASIGWYLDVGNLVNYGWPEQWVRILGARVLKLDLKGFSRTKRDAEGLWKGFGVEIGDGDCNWPAVMQALDGIGYTGWATAEVGGGDENRLRAIKARMDRVLAS